MLSCGFVNMCCCQYFKDTKWKQITTPFKQSYFCTVLLSIFQRYKMKANHNHPSVHSLSKGAVVNISKIQNESKSQLLLWLELRQWSCCQYFKDTKWKQITTGELLLSNGYQLLSIFQRYKMKANHNPYWRGISEPLAVVNISKIQNESKSQLFNLSSNFV